MTLSTESLYDQASGDWERNAPLLLSDYTARPFLLEWCEPVRGRNVLDLGCGEGYFARQLKRRGADTLVGMDLSSEMVARAREEEHREPLGIAYDVGNAADLDGFGSERFDLVVAVFLFNYLSRRQMATVVDGVFRVLKTGGHFVFAVPHPSLPFTRIEEPPFYFSPGDSGYFSGQDQLFEGEIYRRDGVSVPVRCIHKTLSDYFRCLGAAGFTQIPDVEELHVTSEMVELAPAFFGPLVDQPLHLAIRVRKN